MVALVASLIKLQRWGSLEENNVFSVFFMFFYLIFYLKLISNFQTSVANYKILSDLFHKVYFQNLCLILKWHLTEDQNVPHCHINLFYKMDLQSSDLKSELSMKTEHWGSRESEHIGLGVPNELSWMLPRPKWCPNIA